MPQRTIAITVGDVNGIGPEVILKALSGTEIREGNRFIIVGPETVVRFQCRSLELKLPFTVVQDVRELDQADLELAVLDVEIPEGFLPSFGRVNETAGRVAGRALDLAVELAQSGKVHAVVTAPISKQALNSAGYAYPGHTEFLAERTKARTVVMVLLHDDFRVGLATTHCAVAEIPCHLNRQLILDKIVVLHSDFQVRFNIERPRIAVTALNPHAGEAGLFGREEVEVIRPAVEEAQRSGVDAHGPFPADSLFARLNIDRYDAYLAMYHDEGLIPVKMKAFGRVVNYTAGLPIIRTSPDHGTAFDIAGKGLANSSSMEEAIKLAVRLASNSGGG